VLGVAGLPGLLTRRFVKVCEDSVNVD